MSNVIIKGQHYTEEDVLALVNEGYEASDLLAEADPKYKKRFDRATKALRDLMLEIRETFPSANYYSENDGLVIMLGDSHDQYHRSQADLIAADNSHLDCMLSGGGF